MAVLIVTDSIADLPPQVVEELGITVIPINIHFGDEVYRDGIDITTEEFYEKLERSTTIPTTSAPSPGVFTAAYDRLAEETDEILVITLSSKLSVLYEVAQQSIQFMKKECRVEVVDSQLAIMAQGFVVMTAARAARDGARFEEVLEVARCNINRSQTRSTFDTLEYLKRGGRISKAAAFVDSMLHVHPITGMKDGVVESFGRVRTRSKAIDYLYEFAMGYSYIEELAVAY
jgi:DegV family protein with EDD domain